MATNFGAHCVNSLDIVPLSSKKMYFLQWYSQLVKRSEMIERHDVPGCFALRPWSFSIWESIQTFVDEKFKRVGVRNASFPVFEPKSSLDLIGGGYSQISAFLTHARGKPVEHPIAVRPTNDSMFCTQFAKWCQSHRSLPLRINHWCNSVRWERDPVPFLRTREFLLQQGHSAFACEEDAVLDAHKMLDIYCQLYNNLLAIPVLKAMLPREEKRMLREFSATTQIIEPSNGIGIRGCSSHYFGQNLAKIFDIGFESPSRKGQREFVWQSGWALSTRAIGAMVAVHGDDSGLVLPPRVACLQVILMPVGVETVGVKCKRSLLAKVSEIADDLKILGKIRVESDLRECVSDECKINNWELKGVPIRLEIGAENLEKKQALAIVRFSGEKRLLKFENLSNSLRELLEEIHFDMLKNVEKLRDDRIKICLEWSEFLRLFGQNTILLSPFCGQPECGNLIEKHGSMEEQKMPNTTTFLSGARVLSIPFDQPKGEVLPERCVRPGCLEKAKCFSLFGRSY